MAADPNVPAFLLIEQPTATQRHVTKLIETYPVRGPTEPEKLPDGSRWCGLTAGGTSA